MKKENRNYLWLLLSVQFWFFANVAFAALVEPEGQTATLLPDGRYLLIGDSITNAGISSKLEPNHMDYIGQLTGPRKWHTATTLPDGTVLVVGGIGKDGQVLESSELYDPATQTFSSIIFTGQTPRAYHSATLLTDGTVLVAGGVSNNWEILSTAEIFDPKTGTTRAVPATLGIPRKKHSSTILADGTVLFHGGFDAKGNAIRIEETYNPEAMNFSYPDRQYLRQLRKQKMNLAASIPYHGQTNVAPDALIVLHFVTPISFQQSKSIALLEEVNTRIVLAEEGRLVFITPEQHLIPDTSYTVTFPAGENLENQTVRFRTAAAERFESERDDEEWSPQSGNFSDNWRTGRSPSPWQTMEPLKAPPGVTALAGQVLKLNGEPLRNVTLSISGKEARTDDTGRFLLNPIDPGKHEFMIDGTTADKHGRKYGIFEVRVEIVEGETNVLSYTIWMPRIDSRNSINIPSPTTDKIVVTTPRIPGLELHIPPNTVIKDHQGNVVTELTMTPIPLDRPPFPIPENVPFPLYFTIQPGCAYVYGSAGIRIVYPNISQEPGGSHFDFWHYNPEDEGWYIYGLGNVSEDGTQVISDYDTAIYEFTGSMFSPWPLDPPAEGPGTSCGFDGDPVDCSTGLFVNSDIDFALEDVLPIYFVRTYRSKDIATRSFGRGTSHTYDLNIWLENNEVYLVQPNGAKLRYARITSGYGYGPAEIFEHTESPGAFYKSRAQSTLSEWKVTLRNGTTFTFTYQMLNSILDRNGNSILIDRYGRRIFSIRSSNGKSLVFTRDQYERITQIRDNTGRTVTYVYDSGGRVWKVIDPTGRVLEYTYDSQSRMLTIKKPSGQLYVTNQYDTNGRVIKQTRADGTTYLFSYTTDAGNKVVQTNITDPRGTIRRLTFNDRGYILTDTRAHGTALGQTLTYERTPNTNFVSGTTDNLGRRTTFAYDASGNLTNITALAGTPQAVTVSVGYESIFHQPVNVTDPLNHTISNTRDSFGNPVSLTDPLGNTAYVTYNASGQPTSIRDPLGNVSQFAYDLGDLSSATDPLGQSVNQFVDSAGRVVSQVLPLSQTSKYEYDQVDRLVRTINSIQGTISFVYDVNDNLLNIADERGNVTSYGYDDMDRMISRTDPLGQTETYQYDSGGNLTRATDRKGQITSYSYDALGRLTGVTNADGSMIGYTYDAGNRLLQIMDSLNGTITRTYDDLDRLISESTEQGTITYTYDAAGRRTSMTVNGQPAVQFTYDNANRLIQVVQGTSVIGMAYDAAGRRTSVTLSNGVILQYRYDAASQLIEITYLRGATVIGNIAYEYDAAGRRSRTGGTFARTILPNAVNTASYDSANRMLTFGGSAMSYDNNGNLLNDGTNTYAWNARDELISITGPGLTSSFRYDAFGRRITRIVNGTATNFLYDVMNPVQELSGTTPVANLLTGPGIDELWSRTDSNGPRFFLRDGLGSTLGLTDNSGILLTQYTYGAFGISTTTGPASSNTFQFTGRENDGTGLLFYRARYYNPNWQRFLSEDPIGFAAGDTNLYAYVSNNPTNFIDPSGMELIRYSTEDISLELPGIDAPGPAESLIPAWGSGRQALHDFQEGDQIWGAFNLALAISDVCLIKSIFQGLAKGGWKLGSHSWRATANWYKTSRGLENTPPVHHWLVAQNSSVGKKIPLSVKNQPWNLMPMKNRSFHNSVHGKGKTPFNQLEQVWYGTPEWYKATVLSGGGRGVSAINDPCSCP